LLVVQWLNDIGIKSADAVDDETDEWSSRPKTRQNRDERLREGVKCRDGIP
jgi:hypothetical protein